MSAPRDHSLRAIKAQGGAGARRVEHRARNAGPEAADAFASSVWGVALQNCVAGSPDLAI